MNKKGLTVVELIVSFSLTIAIIMFLVQIIVGLNEVYNKNGIKTEILNKQYLISEIINSRINTNGLSYITNCGSNCYNLIYNNGVTEKITVNGSVFELGDYVVNLNNATFGNINLNVSYSPTIKGYGNDSIMILEIPIITDIDYNFNIKVLYQFEKSLSLIDDYA